MAETNYFELADTNMVEATNGFVSKDVEGKTADSFIPSVDMEKATEGLRVKFEATKITDGPSLEVNMVEMNQHTEEDQMNKAYPKPEESLLDFLLRCQKKNSETLMCQRCNSVYDRNAAENYERL